MILLADAPQRVADDLPAGGRRPINDQPMTDQGWLMTVISWHAAKVPFGTLIATAKDPFEPVVAALKDPFKT